MASKLDVETALANLVQTAVYPNGTNNPSIINADIAIRPGYPKPADLDADLAAGKARVSIYQPNGMERNANWFFREWQENQINPATITLAVSGKTITVGGTITTPQTCMIIVNGTGYPYAVQPSDTLATVASGIATLIPGASSVGTVVTVPSAIKLIGRISTPGTATMSLNRMEMGFTLSVLAPSPVKRDILVNAINVVCLSSLRLTLPDQIAILDYKKGLDSDMMEKAIIYRCDLFYTVTFETTITQTFYTIAEIITDIEQVQSIS